MKKTKLVTILLALLVLGSTTVAAGNLFSNYSTTVGSFNGNGYTGYQDKATDGANGELRSTTVGGDYVVDARMIESNGTAGSWTRNVDDNRDYALDGHVNHLVDDSVRIQFSNDWNTPVNVQVSGRWRSN